MSLVGGIFEDLTTLSPIVKTAALLSKRVQACTPRASVHRAEAKLFDVAQILHSHQDIVLAETEIARVFSEKLGTILIEGDSVTKEINRLRNSSLTKQLRCFAKRSRLWARASAFEAQADLLLTEVKTVITRRVAAGLETTADYFCSKLPANRDHDSAMAIWLSRNVPPVYSP